MFLFRLLIISHFPTEEFYDGNMIVIRETRSVIRPPVSDVSIFGPYIAQKCRNLQTFRLVKTTEIRRKLS